MGARIYQPILLCYRSWILLGSVVRNDTGRSCKQKAKLVRPELSKREN